MLKPLRLNQGDCIGIVAPAGVINPTEFSKGIKRLEKFGFKIFVGNHVTKSRRYLAGTDRERAEDINKFFSNPRIKAIICARGGYGSVRIIPYLNLPMIRKNPKIFVGSSDITSLLIFLLNKAKLITFHGPMVEPNFGEKPSKLTDQIFLKMITRNEPAEEIKIPTLKILKKGKGEGILTGGCLSIISKSIGTPYEISTRNKILFLEDINESPYSVDRMLVHLRLAGKLNGLAGIIFGTMYKCHPHSNKGYSLIDIIMDVIGKINCPIVFGFPSGHGRHNLTLPLGIKVAIDTTHPKPKIIFKESAVR